MKFSLRRNATQSASGVDISALHAISWASTYNTVLMLYQKLFYTNSKNPIQKKSRKKTKMLEDEHESTR